jgi:hypothetical protein
MTPADLTNLLLLLLQLLLWKPGALPPCEIFLKHADSREAVPVLLVSWVAWGSTAAVQRTTADVATAVHGAAVMTRMCAQHHGV